MAQLLSYGCWKPILKHLDARARIQIAHRCPSLQTLDMQIPVKVKRLQVALPNFQMDDVKFRIKDVRHPKPESVECVQAFQDLERAQEDLKRNEEELKNSDDKRGIRKRIYHLKKSIVSLKKRYTDLRPGHLYFFQITVIHQNQKTILGTASATNKRIQNVANYFIEKMFCREFLIGTATHNFATHNFRQNRFDLSLLKSAKLLVLNGFAEWEDVVALSNTRVFYDGWSTLQNQTVEMVIRELRQHERPVGKKLTVQSKRNTVAGLLDHAATLPGAIRGEIAATRETHFPQCITFPVSVNTELNVYSLNWHPGKRQDVDVFYLNFEIHANGYAQRL